MKNVVSQTADIKIESLEPSGGIALLNPYTMPVPPNEDSVTRVGTDAVYAWVNSPIA